MQDSHDSSAEDTQRLPADTDTPGTSCCIYCGAAEHVSLYAGIRDRFSHVPGEWAFRQCADCKSAQLDPLPGEKDIASFYPEFYGFTPEQKQTSRIKQSLARLEHLCFYRPMYNHEVRRIIRRIGGAKPAPKRLLDVGCGRGLRLAGFKRHGYDVQGMDFQANCVEYVQTELNIPAVCTDIDGLDTAFRTASFDVVVAYYVLEHVLDVEKALHACYRLLKPGGWFVGAVPLVDSVQASVFGSRWGNVTEAPRHISLPSRKGIARVCQTVGFENITIRPDSLPALAATVALSVVPGSASPSVYRGTRLSAIVARLLGMTTALLSIPWCLLNSYMLKRPGHGIVYAQKPVEGSPPG